MVRNLFCLLMFVCFLMSEAVMADFGRAVEAYEKGDYATAYREYLLSAENGDRDAQHNVALMYQRGEGVEQDYTQAHRWFFQAATQGDANAQFWLALLYDEGKGIPKNDREAVRWFLAAAEQGHHGAQFYFGSRLMHGRGVERNVREALRWTRRAAHQGSVTSQFNLAVWYFQGLHVAKNLVLAYQWASLAASQGMQDAGRLMVALEGEMTRKQIDEAQRLAAAFRPRTETSDSWWLDAPLAPDPQTQVTAGPIVRSIQRDLAALGYDPGPADGMIGPRTTQAIQAFQRDAGVEPDGIASTAVESLLAAVVKDSEPKDVPPVAPEQRPEQLKFTSSGSGFFITDQGHVLTNHHVIDGCQEIRVAAPQGGGRARLFATDKANDLVVLRADAAPPVVASFRRSSAELGEDISVAGYPLHGLLSEMNLTTGSVSSTSGLGGDARYLQITAPVQSGNSGGPLLDAAGSVVGVIVAKLDVAAVAQAMGDMPQNVNFAIKNEVARAFLRNQDIAVRETDDNPHDRSRTAVAAEAQQYTVLVECWK